MAKNKKNGVQDLIGLERFTNYGVKTDSIQKALKNFHGAARRFEYVGTIHGAKIFDDYAHHPTEIKATIEAAKAFEPKKLWVVFQPHTYSRTATLFEEFTTCFEKADTVILEDIYAAREIDTSG